MKLALFFLLLTSSVVIQAQKPWNKKSCAVVLTYDDALNIHLDKVIPALDSLNLKGTFFLIGSSAAVTNRIGEWRAAARNGHELGNHTLFHPCDGSLPGRSWVSKDYDMHTYTLRRMRDEIKQNNALLEAIDGKKERTFAYPCGDLKIGDSLYLEPLKPQFVAARGVQGAMIAAAPTDLYNINCYSANDKTGAELIAMVQEAMKTHSLLIFLFHGVGGEHSLNTSAQAHSELIHYLKTNEKEIWNTTFMEAAKYLRDIK